MNYWQTPLLCLRAVEPDDANHFHRWNQDSERASHLDFVWPPTSFEATKRWTAETSIKPFEGRDYHWVIVNQDKTPVGAISTHNCQTRNGVFHLAFDIEAAHRRQGYASAAVKCVLRYYFNELRYQKVTCVVYDFNAASLALHKHLGFVQEGRLRRMVYRNGHFHDKIIFGMTFEEFQSIHNPPHHTAKEPGA